MIDMLKRHEIQVLRWAEHTWNEIAALSDVSEKAARRIAAEDPVTGVDNTAERSRRHVGRPSKADAYRDVLVRALTDNPELRSVELLHRGRAAFNDGNLRRLGGNGRACADCHVPSDSFQLSPSVARARFEALLAKLAHNKNADDPLFHPVDADDFRVNGENARDFSNLVESGLIRVTMPLPANVALIDPATGQPLAENRADYITVIASLAMAALLLAAIGIYGIVSYNAAARTRDRSADGAWRARRMSCGWWAGARCC
jgi:hypothetical protein